MHQAELAAKRSRLNPVQAAVLLSLKEGAKSASQLLKLMGQAGFPARSSVYSALAELERRGYVERFIEEDEILWRLTEKGIEAVERLPLRMKETVESLARYLSFLSFRLGPIVIEEEREGVKELLTYKEFLESELKRVEGRLKEWKKVIIE